MRLLLVASPFLGPASWEPVAAWLRQEGYDARSVAAPHDADVRPPHDLLAAVVAAAADEPVVLVPHSGAGLLVPRLVHLLGDREAGLDLRATVYVDAALAGSDPWTAVAPGPLVDLLRPLADADGLLPPWTGWWDESDLEGLFPDEATREAVAAEQRRLPLRYVAGTIATPSGWATRPSAYLAFGDTYAAELARARDLGWPTTVLAGRHLHMLHDPAGVGAEVLRLLGRVGLVGAGRGAPDRPSTPERPDPRVELAPVVATYPHLDDLDPAGR